ncbi:flagellar basal body rod protein FlgB [Sporolactobacillus sp. THM7-4]|nr:flagellar basal body rod protein FlgB [Sporolactobacillus sp. THM7-4]
MTPLFDIERALNGSMVRQNVIARNIANVDTAGYKAKKVVFDDILDSAMSANRTEPGHLPFSMSDDAGYRMVNDLSGTIQNNGNNVDIDQQMSELAKNQLFYQALGQAAANQFQQFNTVLGGTR